VVSAPGAGSTFTACIPARYRGLDAEVPSPKTAAWALDPSRQPVLVVEDSPDAVLVYDRHLRDTRWQLLAARSVREAEQALDQVIPAAIVLDIVLRGEDTWRFLSQLRQDERTRHVPVLVVSTVDDQRKGFALGADEYALKPVERDWLLGRLDALTHSGHPRRALLVDDDDHSRYVLRRHLAGGGWEVTEAATGREGLQVARELRPDVVFLDLGMPGLDGATVLAAMRSEPVTRDIPVIIATSRELGEADAQAFARQRATMLPKSALAGDAGAVHLQDALLRAGVRSPASGVSR
jgi:CheY-like chemotaxis protein